MSLEDSVIEERSIAIRMMALDKFFILMKKCLLNNAHKGPLLCNLPTLHRLISEENHELMIELTEPMINSERVDREAADLAVCALMASYNFGNLFAAKEDTND